MALVFKSIYYTRRETWDDFTLIAENGDDLFHYSVRPDQQMIVFNHLIDGSWGEQAEVHFDFGATPYFILTTIILGQSGYLLIDGALVHIGDLDRSVGAQYSVKSSMPYQQSDRIYDLDAPPPDGGLVLIDGIDTAQLRGYLVSKLVVAAEGPMLPAEVLLSVGDRSFYGQLNRAARPVTGDEPVAIQGFEVALDSDAGSEILAALKDIVHPTRVWLSLGAFGEGSIWINPPGAVETIKDFCVDGWVNLPHAADFDEAAPGTLTSLALCANGVDVPARFTIVGVKQFADDCVLPLLPVADDVVHPRRVRFRLALPSAIWADGVGDNAISLRISCDGVPLLAGDVSLSRDCAARWVEDIAATGESRLAELLDHVDAAGLASLLSLTTAELLAQIRRERTLTERTLTERMPAERLVVPVRRVDVLRMNMLLESDSSINLIGEEGEFLLHIKARRADHQLIYNRTNQRTWGVETALGCLPVDQSSLWIDIEISDGEAVVLVNFQPWARIPVAGINLDAAQIRGARRLARGGHLRLPPAENAASVGVVELVEDAAISGWVRSERRDEMFQLDLGDGPIALSPDWTDAAEGRFSVNLPADLVEPLLLCIEAQRQDVFGPNAPRLSLGGRSLTWLPEITKSLLAQNLESETGDQIAVGDGDLVIIDRAVQVLDVFEPPQDQAIFEKWLKKANDSTKALLNAPRPHNVEALLVRRARHMLNQRLTSPGDPIFPHIQAVAEELHLARGRLEKFCFSLVPSLCRNDELTKLDQLVPLANFFHYDNEPETAGLSAVAALLVAGGQIGRAVEVLEKLARHATESVDPGCIAFVLRHSEQRVGGALALDAEMQRLRAAVLAVIDAMADGWATRLHDRQMVETMVLLLGRRHLMQDHLARQTTATALKYFGLAPDFWNCLRAANQSGDSDPILASARAHFDLLAAVLASPARIDAELAKINAALRFFRARQNPEALHWMREIAAHVLQPHAGQPDEPELTALLDDLHAFAPAELVRAAALPGSEATTDLIARALPLDDIPHLLREMQGAPAESFDGVERQICALLADPDLAPALLPLIATLGTAGADLLALLAARGQEGDPNIEALLTRFDGLLLKLLDDEPEMRFLPAPFVAALARWGALDQPAHPHLAEMRQLCDGAVRAHFGDLHARALAMVANPAIAIDEAVLNGDALVVICSSLPHLETRVAAIRATWMADLKARGIPCIVAVGKGDNRLDGDVLRLAAPDTAEAAPARMLALLRFVLKHSNIRYLITVADDCYLSVADYFGTLAYRAHHYHGRVIEQHQLDAEAGAPFRKALLQAAQLPADPIPAVTRFVDGAGAICLSRFAVVQAVDHAATQQGRYLTVRAKSADHLLGQLLQMAGIAPEGADCAVCQRVMDNADRAAVGTPASIGEDGFFPSRLAPTKLVRLAEGDDPALIHAGRDLRALTPKKIWNSHQPVAINADAMQLELLSDAAAVARAGAEPLGVICALRDEIAILPHFLAHYRGLGVKSLFVVDDHSSDGSREYLRAQPDVVLYAPPRSHRGTHRAIEWQQALLSHHFLGRWALLAAADEFLIYPGWKSHPLAGLVADLDAEGAGAMAVRCVEMYPFGALEDADFSRKPPFEAAPWFDRAQVATDHLDLAAYGNRPRQISALAQRLMPDGDPIDAMAEKIALLRYQPSLRLSDRLDGAAGAVIATRTAHFAQFKYHFGLRAKLGAAEHQHDAMMLAQHPGGFGARGVSVKFGKDGFGTE